MLLHDWRTCCWHSCARRHSTATTSRFLNNLQQIRQRCPRPALSLLHDPLNNPQVLVNPPTGASGFGVGLEPELLRGVLGGAEGRQVWMEGMEIEAVAAEMPRNWTLCQILEDYIDKVLIGRARRGVCK